MRYAPVLAFQESKQKWRVIGVFVNNAHGIALVRINRRDQLVAETPAYQALEEVYNKEFEEGEVTFYNRDPGETSSHVDRIKTDDPKFLEKYREQLERSGKFIRIGEVLEIESENVTDNIDALLREVIKNGIKPEGAVSR